MAQTSDRTGRDAGETAGQRVARLVAYCGLAACQAGASLPAAGWVLGGAAAVSGGLARSAIGAVQPTEEEKRRQDERQTGGGGGAPANPESKAPPKPADRAAAGAAGARGGASGAAGARGGGGGGGLAGQGRETSQDDRERMRRAAEGGAARPSLNPNAPPPSPAARPGQPQPGAQPPGAQAGKPGTVQAPAGQAAGAAPIVAAPGEMAVPVGEGPIGLSDETFTFSAYSAPVELTVLVDFVRDEFDLQVIYTDNGLVGQTVVFNTPITVQRGDVLRFLNMLLAQRDYVMIQDPIGFYIVQPKGTVLPAVGAGALHPTRIIPTPGLRPSSLSGIISGLVNLGRAAPAGGATGGSSITYLDDLGVIVINDSPNVTRMVEDLIGQLVEERRSVQIHRLEVQNIAASSARDRILELLSGGSSQGRIAAAPVPAGQQGQGQPQAPVSLSSTLSNMAERLTIDLGSNSLLFRGREDEADYVLELLMLVDVESSLITKWYPVGTSTSEAVAAEGRRLQLGDSVSFSMGDAGAGLASRVQQGGAAGVAGLAGSDLAGSGFVIYPDSGGFVYRGTPRQHARVEALVAQLRDLSASEEIVYEFYKLKHGTAEEIAATLQDLISSAASTGRSPLLGRNLGTNQGRQSSTNTRDRQSRNQPAAQPGQGGQPGQTGGEGTVSDLTGEDVFVIADVPNNQVVVKAPLKLQPQIKRLIDKLDLRRPQVYIEAQIISITDSKNFRLAVEAQGIIGQWAYNTNFGLSSFGTGGSFDQPKSVATNLSGLTTALIKSKYVPFVVNALQNNTGARIVATPQVLVDDNVEAEVRAEDQQPTLTTSQGTSTTQQSFGGFESAGPRLIITAQISEGGYMKLNYEITLSAFQGDPISPGVPPARQENTIRAESVTVPSDSTIVVGGLTFESNQDIVVKVPLLGDIPLLGTLFRDTRKNDRRTTFFVFITPKIMRDPNFADLRLMTLGPLKDADLPSDWPEPKAERMEFARPPVLEPLTEAEIGAIRGAGAGAGAGASGRAGSGVAGPGGAAPERSPAFGAPEANSTSADGVGDQPPGRGPAIDILDVPPAEAERMETSPGPGGAGSDAGSSAPRRATPVRRAR